MLFVSLQNTQVRNLKPDGFELRLDYFSKIDKKEIQAFRVLLKVPILLTLIPISQGGHFIGTEQERFDILEDLLSINPEFIDLGFDTSPLFVNHILEKFPSTKIIFSYHNFKATPKNLSSILKQMMSTKAFAYKIATMAQSSLDALRVLRLLKKHKNLNLSGLCMGQDGQITRILGPVFGNFIDFASVDDQKKTAEGQLTFSQLDHIYHYFSLNTRTNLYGLIGDPVEHSMSHFTHNAVLNAYNAVYVKMRVSLKELPAFLPLAKKCGFLGLSVTTPLKESIVSLLKHVDFEAKKIGAVNTLVFKKRTNSFKGYNTDGKGALDALEEKIFVDGKKILLLGAGGAARAIAYQALNRGASLMILNRTLKRACILAKEFGCRAGTLKDLLQERYDIAINATSHEMPLKPLCGLKVAMDISTRSLMSPFLLKAKENKSDLVFGYEMFIHQAVEQFRLWLNTAINKDLLRQACLAFLDKG